MASRIASVRHKARLRRAPSCGGAEFRAAGRRALRTGPCRPRAAGRAGVEEPLRVGLGLHCGRAELARANPQQQQSEHGRCPNRLSFNRDGDSRCYGSVKACKAVASRRRCRWQRTIPRRRARAWRASGRGRPARGRDSARLRAAPRSLPLMRLPAASCEGASSGREQAEVDVHGLEGSARAAAVAVGRQVTAGDVGEQRAEGGGRRRRRPGCAEALGGGGAAGQQADGGALDVALAAGDLAGEAQPRLGAQAQLAVEQLGRVEEGVAVQPAEPRELGVRRGPGSCGRCAPARRASAWSGSRPCSTACRAHCPGAAARRRRGARAGLCGLVRPTGFMGPKRRVSRPRSAITSIGRQPSK